MGIRLPAPHPGQIAVRQQAKRFSILAAGRRWRKTTLCMSIAVEAAAQHKQIIWGAPVLDQCRTGFEETQRAAAGYATFNQTRLEANFPGGGRILFRSLDDPDNVRSKSADGIVIDEYQDCRPEAWTEVLRPMLIDTNGWAWLIGTSRFNHFFDEWNSAANYDDTAAWQAPTLGVEIQGDTLVRKPHPLENPNIPFAEIQRMFDAQPLDVFRSEILCEWINTIGSVFRNIHERCTLESLTDKFPLYLCQPYVGRFVVGVDVARKNDYTVITVMDANTGQTVYMDRFSDTDWDLQKERIKAVNEAWKPLLILIEENSIGQPFVEELSKTLPVQGFLTTGSSKPDLINALILAFEKDVLRTFNQKDVRHELQAFERSFTKAGHVQFAASGTSHDDIVISLALANKARNDVNVSVSDASTMHINLWSDSRTMSAHRDAPHARQHQHRNRHAKRHSVWN